MCAEDIFLFLACTNIWVPENEFSMPRFVFAFIARVRVRAEPVAILPSKRKHVSSYSLYSKYLTRSEFWVPASCIAYTNITHIAISLSLCKYTLSFKSEDHFFVQPMHLRLTRTIITYRIRYLGALYIIFLAEKAAPLCLLDIFVSNTKIWTVSRSILR